MILISLFLLNIFLINRYPKFHEFNENLFQRENILVQILFLGCIYVAMFIIFFLIVLYMKNVLIFLNNFEEFVKKNKKIIIWLGIANFIFVLFLLWIFFFKQW